MSLIDIDFLEKEFGLQKHPQLTGMHVVSDAMVEGLIGYLLLTVPNLHRNVNNEVKRLVFEGNREFWVVKHEDGEWMTHLAIIDAMLDESHYKERYGLACDNSGLSFIVERIRNERRG